MNETLQNQVFYGEGRASRHVDVRSIIRMLVIASALLSSCNPKNAPSPTETSSQYLPAAAYVCYEYVNALLPNPSCPLADNPNEIILNDRALIYDVCMKNLKAQIAEGFIEPGSEVITFSPLLAYAIDRETPYHVYRNASGPKNIEKASEITDAVEKNGIPNDWPYSGIESGEDMFPNVGPVGDDLIAKLQVAQGHGIEDTIAIGCDLMFPDGFRDFGVLVKTNGDYMYFPDKREYLKTTRDHNIVVQPGDWVYVGSRKAIFDLYSLIPQGNVHE